MSSKTLARVELVPWDHTSDKHCERMLQQRIGCGWSYEMVDIWKEMSAKGVKTMYWIEATPLLDSASTLWGSPRKASQRPILPIGHVGLGFRPGENEKFGLPSQGVVWMGPLYVSWALQQSGLGAATMQAVESMVASPPLNVQLIALDAIPEEQQFDPALLARFYFSYGNPKPVISNEVWYRKQGYEEFHVKHEAYFSVDPETGEKTPLSAIFFKKALGK